MIDCDDGGNYEVVRRTSDDRTGQRARTASFLRGRRAPMTIDAHVLYAGFHYVCISPVDLRASTSSSTSIRVKNCPLTISAPIPVSSRV